MSKDAVDKPYVPSCDEQPLSASNKDVSSIDRTRRDC